MGSVEDFISNGTPIGINSNQDLGFLLNGLTPTQSIYARANHSYSGCDMHAVVSDNRTGSSKIIGNLATISYSIHREKVPVRSLGRTYPKGFTRGQRCLPATENVLVQNRGYIPINQVNIGDYVQSLPGQYNKVLEVYQQGFKDCNHLMIQGGYDLSASYDHPISTPNGWIEAAQLKPGDLVNIAAIAPSPIQDMPIPDWVLIITAYLLGDGCIHIYEKKSGSKEYRLSLSIADTQMDTIGKETEQIFKDNSIQFSDSRRGTNKCIERRISTCLIGHAKTDWHQRQYNELHQWLLRLNLYDTYSHNKFIPNEFIAHLSKRQISLFLNRLYSTDGSYCISEGRLGNPRLRANYSSCSEPLIDGIRLLLLKLGIVANKTKGLILGKVGGRPNIISRYDSWRLDISDALMLLKFIKRVNIYSKEHIITPNITNVLRHNIRYGHPLRVSRRQFYSIIKQIIVNRNNGARYNIGLKKLASKFNLQNNKLSLTCKLALDVAKAVDDPSLTDLVATMIGELIDQDNEFVELPVISNNQIGLLRVYDLTVEDNHSFIASFVHVHNTLAGTLVFTLFDRYALYDIARVKQKYDTGVGEQAYSLLGDQMAPFDVYISFQNELGDLSQLNIYGIELIDEGQVMSINDIFTESTHSYVARDIDIMYPRALGKVLPPSPLLNFNVVYRFDDSLNNAIKSTAPELTFPDFIPGGPIGPGQQIGNS